MQTWQKLLGSVFGTGYLPIASGTWGAGVAALCFLPFYGNDGRALVIPLVVICMLGTWIGALAAKQVEPEWGEDPSQFVFDEVIGMWLAMIGHIVNLKMLFFSFLLFRIFDILKPFGIRRLEKVGGGWGVMLDDVAAGLAANLVLYLLNHFHLLDFLPNI